MRLILLTLCASLSAGIGMSATVGETDRFLPLVQDGAGWSTVITVVNLSKKPGLAVVTFLTSKASDEAWQPGFKVTSGKAIGNVVELPLAPGAMGIIETNGTAASMTRGFVEVFEPFGNTLSANAVVTYRDGERVTHKLKVPLAPGHERRSTIAVDLTDTSLMPELILVTMTTTTTLDFVFRNLAGEIVHRDQIYFDNKQQVSVNVREQWPQLKEFRGTIEWNVTFPGADRYESRFLSGLCLNVHSGQPWTVSNGMTLLADQASTSPY